MFPVFLSTTTLVHLDMAHENETPTRDDYSAATWPLGEDDPNCWVPREEENEIAPVSEPEEPGIVTSQASQKEEVRVNTFEERQSNEKKKESSKAVESESVKVIAHLRSKGDVAAPTAEKIGKNNTGCRLDTVFSLAIAILLVWWVILLSYNLSQENLIYLS